MQHTKINLQNKLISINFSDADTDAQSAKQNPTVVIYMMRFGVSCKRDHVVFRATTHVSAARCSGNRWSSSSTSTILATASTVYTSKLLFSETCIISCLRLLLSRVANHSRNFCSLNKRAQFAFVHNSEQLEKSCSSKCYGTSGGEIFLNIT